MNNILYTYLGLSFVPTIIGLLVIVHIFRKPKPPVDQSNIIGRIRHFWFALTRPELYVDKQPWLKNDEYDNVKQVTDEH